MMKFEGLCQCGECESLDAAMECYSENAILECLKELASKQEAAPEIEAAPGQQSN
jgi:hypothetical protein